MRAWATTSRRASEPPLTADELHRVRWGLGGLLALWSAWGVFFFELGGALLLPPLTVAVVAVLLWPALPGRLPAWGWRLVFPGLILFVAADFVLKAEPLAALLRLNLLLIAVRAVGYRRPREDLQLVVLCLFLVVVSGVLTVAIGFLVHILVFTGLALTYLLATTLSAAGEPESGDSEAWMRAPWARLLGRLRRVIDWRVVAASGVLYFLVVAVASLLFFAMPRFQIENSLGFLQLKGRKSLSGFSDTVKLGDVTDIAQDTTTALRAELSDPRQVPAMPYWRMVALDEYREGSFLASRGLRQHERRTAELRDFEGTGRQRPGAANWTFYYEAGVSRFLPLTGTFARMRLRDARALVVNERAGTLALRDEPQTMFAYRVEGLALGGQLADVLLADELRAAPPASADFPRTLLAVPPGAGNAAVLDGILAEITGGERLGSAEFTRRAVDWLDRRHRYSMKSAIPPGPEDLLVRWVRSEEPGHCELFAGGFALLARRAGYPVRVVTGFKGGTWNAFEQYFMVRNSDAHAWCELLQEDGRWLRVDPTPGAQVGDAAAAVGEEARLGLAAAVDRSWLARLDTLRMLWYRRIVNFDRGTQEEMVDTLKSATRRTGQALIARLDGWGRRLRDWLLRPWDFGRLAAHALPGLGGGALLWAAWRWRYLWWLRWVRRGRIDPVRREAGRWLRRFAGRAIGAERAPVVAELQRLRYGAVAGRPAPLRVFQRAKREWRARR